MGSLAICGGAISVAALFVTLLAATEYPKKPEHLTLLLSVIMGTGAFVPGALAAAVITYMVSDRVETARNIVAWLVLGFGYGIMVPFATGMFIPLSTVFVRLSSGVITAEDVFPEAVDALFRGISVAFSHGAFGVFTGMLAGVILGVGAWVIDRINTMPDSPLARYGPPAIAVVLAIVVLAIAAFGPPETLAKLG